MASVVQRATLDDLEGILDVFMICFNDEYFRSLFPPRDGLGREFQRKAWRGFITSKEIGIQEAQVYVVKNAEGVVESATLFWICTMEDGGVWLWRRRYPKVDAGLDEEKVAQFFDAMDEQHHKVMGDAPHVYFELLLTHPSARRRGHASALLRRACESADERDDVMYLDSDGDVMQLYEREGFVHQKDAERTSIMFPMMRKRKSERGS